MLVKYTNAAISRLLISKHLNRSERKLAYFRTDNQSSQHRYKKRKPRAERVEELLDLVRDAINTCKVSGQPITTLKLSGIVGVHYAALNRYPEVRTLMKQTVTEDKQQRQERRFLAREEELTQRAMVALPQLRDNNRRISKKAVAKIVNVSNISLFYPKVKALIESAIQAQHTTNESA